MLSGLSFVSHKGKDKKSKKSKKERKKRKSEKSIKDERQKSTDSEDMHEEDPQSGGQETYSNRLDNKQSEEFSESALNFEIKAKNDNNNNNNYDTTGNNDFDNNQQMDDILGRIMGKDNQNQPKIKEQSQQLEDEVDKQPIIGLNVKKQDSKVCRNVVGDGGMSYRLKMYERMKERAQENGVPVEEEIYQRFGDVQKFMDLINQAEQQAAPDRQHLKAARQRRIASGMETEQNPKKQNKDGTQAAYLLNDPSKTMKKPKEFSRCNYSSKRQKNYNQRDPQNDQIQQRQQHQQHYEDPKNNSVENKFPGSIQQIKSGKNKQKDESNFKTPNNVNLEENLDQITNAQKSSDFLEMQKKSEDVGMNNFANDGKFLEQFGSYSNSMELNLQYQQQEQQEKSNVSMAQKLKQRLQALKNPELSKTTHASPSIPQIIDSSGKPMPGTFGRSSKDPGSQMNQTKEENIRQTLKRMKYGEGGDFEGDDRKGGGQFGSGPSHIEDDDDFKEMEMNQTKKRKKLNMEQMEQKEHQKQVQQQKRWQMVYDKCRKCLGGPAREPLKHLTVAIGQFSYLSLPYNKQLVENQCEILPVEHLPSWRQVDDAVWTEIRNFKKSLIMMFKKQDLEVIFMETALRVKGDYQRHTSIQVIPVDPDSFSKARFFFKKALEESESEWSTHHAKRVIDTREKRLRRSIPVGFPYFHVEFGIEGGFVHVVDDENKFNENLGRQTIVGLLQLPEQRMYAGDARQGYQVERQKVQKFLEIWDPFDWTKQLDD